MTLKQAIRPHIEQAIAGSEYHLGKMLEAARPHLEAMVHKIAGRYIRDSEDITQAAMLKLYNIFKRGGIHRSGGMPTYFHTTIRNEYLNWWRLEFQTNKRIVRGDMILLSDLEHPEDTDRLLGVTDDPTEITDLDRMEAVQEMVDEMNPKYGKIFRLRYVEKKKYQEVADLMEMPLNSVRTSLWRIKQVCTERAREKYSEMVF